MSSSKLAYPKTSPSLRREYQNGLRPRSEAEAVVHGSCAGGELAAFTGAVRMVAKCDVVTRAEAVRVWRVEARTPAGVHCARPSTNTTGANTAVGHGSVGILRRARSERVHWLADEGELGVRIGDPVRHLLVRCDVRRKLSHDLVSISHG